MHSNMQGKTSPVLVHLLLAVVAIFHHQAVEAGILDDYGKYLDSKCQDGTRYGTGCQVDCRIIDYYQSLMCIADHSPMCRCPPGTCAKYDLDENMAPIKNQKAHWLGCVEEQPLKCIVDEHNTQATMCTIKNVTEILQYQRPADHVTISTFVGLLGRRRRDLVTDVNDYEQDYDAIDTDHTDTTGFFR